MERFLKTSKEMCYLYNMFCDMDFPRQCFITCSLTLQCSDHHATLLHRQDELAQLKAMCEHGYQRAREKAEEDGAKVLSSYTYSVTTALKYVRPSLERNVPQLGWVQE